MIDAAPATDVAPDAAVVAKVDATKACAALRPEVANPVLGAFPRAAEPLLGTDVDGHMFELLALRGKVVLVSFTSTWDMVTKAERPTFAALRDAIGDDLVIVRVVSSESVEKAQADRVASEGDPTVFDEERSCSPLGALTNRWGVKAVPESFLVDRAGNVRFYFVNKRDWSTPEAEACVRALLADTTPPIAVPPLGTSAPDECAPPAPPPPPGTAGGGEVRGSITFAPAVKRKARPGVIFLLAKQADASGAPTGMPLAVDKLEYKGGAVAFVLDQSKQMISGPQLSGNLVLTARWDQDGDAMTKEPGDITGTVRVTAPASGVKLVLDTVLP